MLEQDVVKFELNPSKEHSIFGSIGKQMGKEAIRLKDVGPPVLQVFTRGEVKKINPLE